MTYTKDNLPTINEGDDVEIEDRDGNIIEASVTEVVENTSSVTFTLSVDEETVKMIAVATKVELHRDNKNIIVRDVQVV